MTVIAVLATGLPFDPPIVIFGQAWMGQRMTMTFWASMDGSNDDNDSATAQTLSARRCAQAGAIWSTNTGLSDCRCRQSTPWQSMRMANSLTGQELQKRDYI